MDQPLFVCELLWTNLCLFVSFYGPTLPFCEQRVEKLLSVRRMFNPLYRPLPCHSWETEFKTRPFQENRNPREYSLSLQSRRFLQQCHDPLSCRQFAKASIRLPDNMRITPINANSPKAMKYNFPKTILTSGMSRI